MPISLEKDGHFDIYFIVESLIQSPSLSFSLDYREYVEKKNKRFREV